MVRSALFTMVGAVLTATGAVALAQPPTGANDWTCRPGAAHPRPVVLVHGTSASMAQSWAKLSPLLKREGYCVFALNYGENAYSGDTMYGLASVAQSAHELAGFVEQVRKATASDQVDVVGHSQGGTMPRHYLKFLGGAARVHALIAIAPINRGTNSLGLSAYAEGFPGLAEILLGPLCAACADLLSGSAFLHRLNQGGDTVPGVSYWVIASRHDDVVTPFESQLLQGPQVTSIVLQDLCPRHRVYHEKLPFDDVVLRLVRNALDPGAAQRPACN